MAENRTTSDLIYENLKSVFLDELNREVPDRFTNLIEQLRAQDGNSDQDESRV